MTNKGSYLSIIIFLTSSSLSPSKIIKKMKTFQEVFPPDSKMYFSTNKRGMKATNIKGETPITGHEKLNSNPLKMERNNNFFILF